MNETAPYDVVIIGSGLGGLISALLLAMEGKSVCVLEKNNQYGGNLQTFVRKRKIFDTGVHYLGGLDKGQNLYQCFSYLDILSDLHLKQMDKDAFDWISFGNESKRFPIAQGYEKFRNQLLDFFPEEQEAIELYSSKMKEFCAKFGLYQLRPERGYTDDDLRLGLFDFLDEITSNELLKSVLTGNNLLYAGSEDTPFYVHALVVNSYIESAWKIELGGSQIAKALVRKIRKFKGVIHRRTEINQSIYEDDRLIGVVDAAGKKYFGSQFISNIDLNKTIELFGADRFPKMYRNRIQNLPTTTSAFSLYLVVKPRVITYPNANRYHFEHMDLVRNASQYKLEEWGKSFMISYTEDSENIGFAESVTILTYMHYEEVAMWESTCNMVKQSSIRDHSYQEFKRKKSEALLHNVLEVVPELEGNIEYQEASTPLSYRDYIGSYDGNMYGFTKEKDHPMRTMISPKTKIPNLLLTGQQVRLHGILGVTISAIATCEALLGEDYLFSKVRNKE